MRLAYIRISTEQQDTNNQKLEILEYAHRHNTHIDEFVEVVMSSRRNEKERLIDYITDKLKEGDTLIVTELSRLGRSTSAVITFINEMLRKNIRVLILKQNLDLKNGRHDMNSKIIVTLFSLFAELERDLISSRIKEALAAKRAQGVKLGKPKGTIQKSKFDEHVPRIKELLALGLSIRKTSKLLGYSNPIGLTNYVKKRNLRQTNITA